MPIVKTYIDDEGHEVITWSDGSKYWYKNGQLHRENNQARIETILPQKINFYCLNAEMYQSKEYWIRLLLQEY